MRLRALLLVVIAAGAAGCATRPYVPEPGHAPGFLDRRIIQQQDRVRVSAAVPDAGETESYFSLPLYEQGVQPVWLEIQNNGSELLRLTLWSIDPDYFSPIEVAWMNRGGYSKEGKAAMERWFYENGIERRIPPGETRSGFVFTQLEPGTKGFNVDIIGADLDMHSFTFFVPIPGFTADHMEVDFAALYTEDEIADLGQDELRDRLSNLPCCPTDASGRLRGVPFNVALIGTGLAVRRSLLRANWQETEAGSTTTAIARMQRYRGRRPDGTFIKARPDGSERRELRLWLTPFRVGRENIWLGQTGIVVQRAPELDDQLLNDADIDAATSYLMQDLWYSQSLARVGFVEAWEPVSRDSPDVSFTGFEYFSSGLRGVFWLSEDPVALDETVNLEWTLLRDY